MSKLLRRLLCQSWTAARAPAFKGERSLASRAIFDGRASKCGLAGGTALAVGALAFVLGTRKPAEAHDDMQSWERRWAHRNINFHLSDINPVLSKFLDQMLEDNISPPHFPKRILVPLCGKTVDMTFLQSLGHKVVGVDGVRAAAEGFIEDNKPTSVGSKKIAGMEVLELSNPSKRVHPLRFVVGDFFRMTPEIAETFEACLDRGSLVAISPALRQEYVGVISKLMDRGGRILLVTVEHDPFGDGKLGPPFSVSEEDVHRLYSPAYSVKLLQREDRMGVEPEWARRGCTYFREAAYLLTKRN